MKYWRWGFIASGSFVTVSFMTLFSPLFAAELSLALDQTQYISNASYSEQANQYSNVTPSVRAQNSFLSGQLTTKMDASVIIPMNDQGELHFYSQDLYLRYQSRTYRGNLLAFTFGRSQRLWSQLDADWGLGLWQPLFRVDYVNPLAMGLTGFFAEALGHNMKITIFASPLHLPDQQSRFEIENGEMVSGSRWFRAPVRSLEIGKDTDPIHYDMNKPKAKDVAFNGVYALSATAGDEISGPWVRGSFADKPMNQYHVAIQTEGSVLLDRGIVQPIIHPKVVRHQLTTLEAGYSWDDRHKVYISATAERIRDPKFSENWLQTELKDASYFGAGGAFGLSRIGLKQTLVTAAFVQRIESDAANATMIEGEIEGSLQRPIFNQMASLGVSHPIYRQRQHKFTGQMKYTHSFSDRGDWISAQVGYSPERRWNWYLGMDIFGAPDDIEGRRSFISSYRNNDRVFGGVSHVF